MAVYDFCLSLPDNLRERKLIRKSLVLSRNEKEPAEIDGKRSEMDGEKTVSTASDDERGEDATLESSGALGEGAEVDDFRKSLMTSWDSTADESGIDQPKAQAQPAEKKVSGNNLSHLLWSSMLGNEENSDDPDMFNQVIAAVDKNAILSIDEDALIILSPYNMCDIIGIRRTMARYGQTRTIIIVNSRMETLPLELDPAVLVYGLLLLIARLKGNDADNGEAGLKVVAMKRFPAHWSVYINIMDGFVEAAGPQSLDSSDKLFPPPEWMPKECSNILTGYQSNETI